MGVEGKKGVLYLQVFLVDIELFSLFIKYINIMQIQPVKKMFGIIDCTLMDNIGQLAGITRCVKINNLCPPVRGKQ